MTSLTKTRIQSIDLLRGLVMVIMALDHVRDYFHASAFLFNPADPVKTSLPIFFTRWITHFCAPSFSFLAGVSAFMVGRRKTNGELSAFLVKRGLWLVFIELTVVTFGWYFDVQFRTINLIVIWSLGISMIILAVLIHLPRAVILLFSCILIFGHNLLDSVHFEGSISWSLLHEFTVPQISTNTRLFIGYPIVPWVAVMTLGYCFGSYYDSSFQPDRRQKIFNIVGFGAIALFILLRWTNLYGNSTDWQSFNSFSKGLVSFLNPAKYPPSLQYLLMTLGCTLVFLANSENLRGRVVNFFSTFGRVPFFYYILHIYLIHIVAMIFAQVTGFGAQKLILPFWITEMPWMKGYGFSLWVVYLVWIGTVAALYPLCKKFDRYKSNNKEKGWLSYL